MAPIEDSLASLEDDGLGEELQVIWELEPGARPLDRIVLPEPTGFDAPPRLDAFLDAVRWGATSSADVRALQAPFRSGIEIEDYQLDPVVRAIQMPRVNLLVADDVGLGKTIEAGLVVQELIVRHRARRVLIVCPASLSIQWRDQMRDKFGLEFRIVDADLHKRLRRERGLHANPWTHFPRLITSIDFLKRERPLRLLREILPVGGEPAYPRRFDMLVVDEAHGVAPAGRGRYATDSLRTQAIRTLAPHCEHKLFLTATPHNGYPESFSALLELLDNQRFARGLPLDRSQLQAVMGPPPGYAEYCSQVVLVERLREVRALIGFTRIESPGDFGEEAYVTPERRGPLSRTPPHWLPASEVRGEGIFIQFGEETVRRWLAERGRQAHEADFLEAHRGWRRVRRLDPVDAGFPGLRYVLLHALAHVLMRELALECGYTAASIRERVYSAPPDDPKGPVAGVLLYTAAADSEGTLGGLVSLGEPARLGRLLDQALDGARLCASDPLCAEHHPWRDGQSLHGAACHACLFVPETSCERGNRYLDRAVLVETVHTPGLAFFKAAGP